MLVDVGDAVLPKVGGAPGFGGKIVFEDALVAVEGGALDGFLFEGHLADEVVEALVFGLGWVFVDVLTAILVEVDPAVMIDVFAGDDGLAGLLALVVPGRVQEGRGGRLLGEDDAAQHDGSGEGQEVFHIAHSGSERQCYHLGRVGLA